MNAKERLQAVQSELQKRAVHDVKFCLAKGVSEASATDVMGKVADFMEAYVQGKCVEVTQIGNSRLRA